MFIYIIVHSAWECCAMKLCVTINYVCDRLTDIKYRTMYTDLNNENNNNNVTDSFFE